MAGAAAGTALLGPGVGTTIGMKAGQFTERLFRKKPPKKTDPAKAAPAKVDASVSGPAKEGAKVESASPGSKPAAEPAGRR